MAHLAGGSTILELGRRLLSICGFIRYTVRHQLYWLNNTLEGGFVRCGLV